MAPKRAASARDSRMCPGGWEGAALLAGLAARGSLPRSQGTNAPAVPGKCCSPLLKDKSVYNKVRERAGCQANKLGGNFFYLILCAQFPVSLQKAI